MYTTVLDFMLLLFSLCLVYAECLRLRCLYGQGYDDCCSNELFDSSRAKVESVNYHTVIDASDIREMEAPEFSVERWSSEEEYRTYLDTVQPLFDEYAGTGTIHAIEYHTLDDVTRYRDEELFLNNFWKSFLLVGESVNVRKCLDGTYKVTDNGRHRMYVAKKYGLKLLVHVTEEECTVWE